MVQFDDDFFKGEVIDGFYVQPIMKRIWACYINIISEIDIVCKRHGIKYMADYGTALGAARHNGFIPWDDDFDITMRRKDYMKFIKYAKEELPSYLTIQNTYENPKHPTRVNYQGMISTNPEILELRYGCPYVCGIDIFILDNLPREKDELELVRSIWVVGLNLAREWDEEEPNGFKKEEKWDYLNEFEQLTGQTIDRNQPIPPQLAYICDRLGAMYYEDETDYGAVILSYFVTGRDLYMMPIEYLEKTIEVPFQNITIPIPEQYDDYLTQLYGEWRVPVRGTAFHDYPFFRSQVDLLRSAYERQGATLPKEYEWDDDVNREE